MIARGWLVEVSVAIVNGAGFVKSIEDGFPGIVWVFYEAIVWVGDGDFVWNAGG